ncbi:hypothetical protein DDE82_004845 [Stemphylium lycopersici]|uniref:Uncharacterized protein n=1 Tax=Stemphylium lycopersici TaxID=183478 RepID=A0A364N9M7_STELY|nr:hypothetical protein TW65_05030 [Stemphylium lycopersici]RAR03966.1 hypothetical protein DDE82_004845 [Stemphylium lycopersici]RAR13897.1 hypothetical protein DDE83_002786 [Stemphylium lycopersici]
MAMVGMSPAPTPAPKRRDANKLFDRRQEDTEGVETCAYFDRDYYDPLTCETGSTCLFNTASEWFGCCEDEYACSSINTCTEGTSTECATIENVWETEGITFTKHACVDSYLITTVYFDATDAPESAPLDPITRFITVPGVDVSTPISKPITTTPSTSDDGGKSTPIAPIIGGVVGGVAVLSIIAVGVFLLLRRKKKATSNSVHYNQPEPMGGHNYIAQPMGQPMSHYPPQNGGDDKYPEAIVSPSSPSSPTPPYYPPYSPPQQVAYHVHQPTISQLP